MTEVERKNRNREAVARYRQRKRILNPPNPVGGVRGPRLDRTPTIEAITSSEQNRCSFVMLGHAKFALVDTEDLDRVSVLTWWCGKDSKNREYAMSQTWDGETKCTIYMARFILKSNAPHIDHRDHNCLNNQKHNLRPCSALNNHQNRLPQKHSSIFKGVSAHGKVWDARIRVNRKLVHLGSFKDPYFAAKAYDKAALRYFGEFAYTNQQAGLIQT